MKVPYRARRIVAILTLLFGVVGFLIANPASYEKEIVASEAPSSDTAAAETPSDVANGSSEPLGVTNASTTSSPSSASGPLATEILEKLEVKGRAPKTG